MQRNFILTDVMKTGDHHSYEQFIDTHTIPDQTFELKYTGKKNDVIALVSSDALAGEDLLGADHCNHKIPQKIYELVAVREKCTNIVTGEDDEKDWFHISEKEEMLFEKFLYNSLLDDPSKFNYCLYKAFKIHWYIKLKCLKYKILGNIINE